MKQSDASEPQRDGEPDREREHGPGHDETPPPGLGAALWGAYRAAVGFMPV